MKTMSAIPGFLTMHEVAERLGIVHSGVARYVRIGKLPSVVVGQQKLIPEKSLEMFDKQPVGRPPKKNSQPVL